MVYNTDRLPAARAPRTRRELLSLLQAPDQPLAGSISTYDVQGSGIGYLAATQDTRLDSMAGALLAAFGRNRVAMHASTEHALDQLERGQTTLAYNLLESYTRHRIARGAPLAIVYPQDYTLMLSRSAIIPRQAPRPDLGAQFLDYLLSPRGQQMVQEQSGMRPVNASVIAAAGVRPVGLGVGLLVYLDPLKKNTSWTCGVRRSRRRPPVPRARRRRAARAPAARLIETLRYGRTRSMILIRSAHLRG